MRNVLTIALLLVGCSDVTAYSASGVSAYSQSGESLLSPSDRIVIAHDASIAWTTAFSIVGWYRIDRWEAAKGLAGKWSSGTANVWLLVHQANGKLRLYIAASVDDPGNNYVEMDAGNFTAGAWHHVAVTYSAGTVAIYVDGSAQATTTTGSIASSLQAGTESLVLGAHRDVEGGSGIFNGDMHDVAVYSTAITSGDVTSDYAGTRQDTGLVSWWALGEGAGASAADSVGSNTGAIEATASVSWCTHQSATVPRRVLVLGDSIARGSGATDNVTGFRELLSKLLTAGSTAVEFVGDYSEGAYPENRHSGVRGDTITETYTRVQDPNGPLSLYDPTDVILIVGIGNMATYNSVQDIADYETLARYILDYVSTPSLYFLSLVPATDEPEATDQVLFNAQIRGLRARLIGDGYSVGFVDVYPQFSTAWLSDEKHPDAIGYEYLANTVFRAMHPSRGYIDSLGGQ